MSRQYWITMQKPGDKKHRAVWVRPKNVNSAKEMKADDVIAVYIENEKDSPGSIKYIGQIDRILQPRGRKWLKIATLKERLLADDDGLCPLAKLARILEPNNPDFRGGSPPGNLAILAVRRAGGGKVRRLTEAQFRRIWPSLPCHAVASAERAAADSAEEENEPSVPGMTPQEVKNAVERYAAKKATAYFRQQGYSVDEYRKRGPYDLECQRESETYYVEVKGTQNHPENGMVFVTNNEVNYARQHKERSFLFVFRSIRLVRKGQRRVPTGGTHCVAQWPDVDGLLETSLYRLRIDGVRPLTDPMSVSA